MFDRDDAVAGRVGGLDAAPAAFDMEGDSLASRREVSDGDADDERDSGGVAIACWAGWRIAPPQGDTGELPKARSVPPAECRDVIQKPRRIPAQYDSSSRCRGRV